MRIKNDKDDYPVDVKIGDVAEYDGKTDLLEKLETFFNLKVRSFPKNCSQRRIQYVSTSLIGGPGQWLITNTAVSLQTLVL